jgi:hypothetical protein
VAAGAHTGVQAVLTGLHDAVSSKKRGSRMAMAQTEIASSKKDVGVYVGGSSCAAMAQQ